MLIIASKESINSNPTIQPTWVVEDSQMDIFRGSPTATTGNNEQLQRDHGGTMGSPLPASHREDLASIHARNEGAAASRGPGSGSKRRREQNSGVTDPAQTGSALVGSDDANAAVAAVDSDEDAGGIGDDGDGSDAASERTVVLALLVERVQHGGFQIGAAYCEEPSYIPT